MYMVSIQTNQLVYKLTSKPGGEVSKKSVASNTGLVALVKYEKKGSLNLYGRAPRSPRGVKKSKSDFFFTNKTVEFLR